MLPFLIHKLQIVKKSSVGNITKAWRRQHNLLNYKIGFQFRNTKCEHVKKCNEKKQASWKR
jgi:hypothetical protein